MNARSLILSAALLAAACSPETPRGNTQAVTPPPRFSCTYAVQELNEAQRIDPAVDWGCVTAEKTIDGTCASNKANTVFAKLTDSTERRHFQNLAWCINLYCHKPAGAGWIWDACAQEMSTTRCEREQILCFGD